MKARTALLFALFGCGADTSQMSTDAASDAPPDPPLALRGWQLTAQNVGLGGAGLSCDALPLYTGGAKPAAGATIREQRIETALDLSNGNIIIERSCIRPSDVGRGLPVLTTTDNNSCNTSGCAVAPSLVTVRDSEIDGSLLAPERSAFSTGFLGVGTLQRNYIHGVGSGIAIFNSGDTLDALVENNFITGLTAFGDPATTGNHSDGFTVRDFVTDVRPERRLLVRGNRIDCSSGNDSGAFFIQAYADDIDQMVAESNLLEGNGYQLWLEGRFNSYGTNLHAVNNRFSNTGYGAAHVADGPGWATWQDNYVADPAAPDFKGAPVDEP